MLQRIRRRRTCVCRMIDDVCLCTARIEVEGKILTWVSNSKRNSKETISFYRNGRSWICLRRFLGNSLEINFQNTLFSLVHLARIYILQYVVIQDNFCLIAFSFTCKVCQYFEFSKCITFRYLLIYSVPNRLNTGWNETHNPRVIIERL